MSGSLIEVMMENERRTNRSCTVGALWIAAVCAVLCLIGSTGALGISPAWMYLYLCADVLPLLLIAAYAKRKGYRGSAIKHLMVFGAALIPASMSIPSVSGFFLMPLPIIVAGRYFSWRFVWHTYANMVVLAFLLTIPHTLFGTPCYPICEETGDVLRAFLDGRFDPMRYWRYQVVACFPSLAICLSFFAITVSRLCKDHLAAMEIEARTNARLADVERGLMIAAAEQAMCVFGFGEESEARQDAASALTQRPVASASDDFKTWSTKAIADCIAKCKKRAAADPAFAALVERDPAAAVKEVQAC